MLGNEAALTQCFSNLLGNALKFVAPGTRPQVRVWAERVGGPKAETQDSQPAIPSTVRLSFADNGIGIPKDAHERIFKMFQRLDKSYDGTGVGLTVVRKAVEKMGGKVGLESEPGRGSRFWIELKTAGDSKSSNGQEGPNE
jgi:signal transduction histidine kinase